MSEQYRFALICASFSVAGFGVGLADAQTAPISWHSSVDGAALTGNLHQPPGWNSDGPPGPLVIYLGGGSGDGNFNPQMIQALNHQGWLGLSIAGRQWKLQDTYGCTAETSLAYLDHPDPAIGPGQQDILDAVDWAIANYPVDADRVYITGVSLGGRGAYMMGLKVPHYFAAIAPIAPSSDQLELDIRTSEKRRSYPCRMAVAGGVPGTSPQTLTMRLIQSGRFLIENAYNLPVYHAHGYADTLANNVQGSGSFLHGSHMVNDTSFDGCYETKSGKKFCFGHTPTLFELHKRHPDGYQYAYAFTPDWGHRTNIEWLIGGPLSGHDGLPDPKDPQRLLGIMAFFEQHRRVRSPETVVYKSHTEDLRRAYWLEIDVAKPRSSLPGAIRATRNRQTNSLNVEVVRLKAATIDLQLAQLSLASGSSLTVNLQLLDEPTFDPALQLSQGESSQVRLILRGDFESIARLVVLDNGQPLPEQHVHFKLKEIAVEGLSAQATPRRIVFQVGG